MGADEHSLERELETRSLIRTLHSNPSWSLADLADVIHGGGKDSERLGALTVGELASAADCTGDTDTFDRVRLERARRLTGPDYDAIVLEIVGQTRHEWVASSFVAKRAGGPRWKLQASLRRLVDTGKIERNGTTSATRYRVKRGRNGRR